MTFTALLNKLKDKIPEKYRAFSGQVKMIMAFISIFLMYIAFVWFCNHIINHLNLSGIPARMFYSFCLVVLLFSEIALALPMIQTFFESDNQDLLKWFHMSWSETVKECYEIARVIFVEIFSDRIATILSFASSTMTVFLLCYVVEFLMNVCLSLLDCVYTLSPTLPMNILCVILAFICGLIIVVAALIATGYVFCQTYTWAEKRHS